MVESTNGKVPAEEQNPEDQSAPEEDVSVQDQPQENMETPVEETAGQSSRHGTSHGKLWLVLLLIIIGLPLGWFLLPENTRQQWADTLMNRMPSQGISDVGLEPAPLPRPVVPDTTASVATAPKHAIPKAATSVPVQAPAPRGVAPKRRAFNREVTRPAATSEEVKALMAAIHDLQSNMETLQDKQSKLRQELHARQQLELRIRLRWIANPQSQLPQMANFWQDIALLPMLNEDDRREAEAMRKLAANDADKLDMWSKRLKQLAATLPVPEHQDIIPKPKNPVFSWLTGKFHLRPAPTPEQQALSELRARLLNTAHALLIQIWPEHKTWRHLLADLREQFGDDADLALPERLDGIQKDTAVLRAKAAHWLEEL